MRPAEDSIEREITTIGAADRRQLAVTLIVSFDGIEHVGRLWFAEEEWDDEGIPDRGVISGRIDRGSDLRRARAHGAGAARASPRATVNKRRYLSLRAVTDEILRQGSLPQSGRGVDARGARRPRRRGAGDRLHRASAARARQLGCAMPPASRSRPDSCELAPACLLVSHRTN